MALEKQAVAVNFAQGVELKSDARQIPVGKFLRLVNMTFNKVGLLAKRFGFSQLSSLPSTAYNYLTTFNGDLTAIGTSLAARSKGSNSWVVQGALQPVRVASQSLIRSNLAQSEVDAAVSPNNLVCTVYKESGGAATEYLYAVADSVTGQNLILPTAIPVDGAGAVDKPARVFVLGNYFIILAGANNTGTYTLQATPIRLSDLAVLPTFTVGTGYIPGNNIAMDGAVSGNTLYFAFSTASIIRASRLTSTLQQGSTVTADASHIATHISVAVDESGSQPYIYVVSNDNAATTGYYTVLTGSLAIARAATQWSSGDVFQLATAAQNDSCTVFLENDSPYTYDTGIPNHKIQYRALPRSGSLGTLTTLARGVGIASKAFLVGDIAYLLGTYESDFQSTYFLLNELGKVVSKHVPSNGGGYLATGGPASVTVQGDTALFSHQITSTLQAANKEQGVANPAGIYSTTGINLSSVEFTTLNTNSAEIGKNLNLSGGFPWAYDGYEPTEQGFFLYPDSVDVATSTSGGSITAQTYYYQAIYEWTDNQGNIFRSAPSVPVSVVTTGSSSTNTISVPTLRLTYKTTNPVKIVIYRWSTAQQNYYQVTSITSPLLNDPSVEFVDFDDTLADSSILGNSLIYTTGGVLENVQGPANESPALFDNRLWYINSEKGTELWYSKLVTADTPVETTDLQTYYVAPTIGSNNQLGPIKVLFPMDDKLIAFRGDSIVYINGNGPDATGASNQYSQPIFVTSTVGCVNPRSVVMTPNGLMFESNKGIWLLGRNLSTAYIGAPVETLTQGNSVLAAFTVPETNQVRFTMSNGIVLVFDYYVEQWSWFEGCPGISGTIYEGLHTYINSLGQVRQQSEGYLDGSNPVLMSFQTGWFNLVGLQGYERFYEMYMLGEYFTPFKLNVGIGFDYGQVQQTVQVTQDNYSPNWGEEANWGSGTPWGGPPATFEARVFPDTQRCQAFQITVNEIYDPSYGVAAGAGLTLSGLNLVVGAKKRYRTQTAARSFG